MFMSDTDPEFISNTLHNFYGYRLRKVVYQIHLKRKYKVLERWFCLDEGEGAGLPAYVRLGAKRTGYKTYNNLFACIAYYRMPGPKETSS
jgi:hypothetical protein